MNNFQLNLNKDTNILFQESAFYNVVYSASMC